MVTDTGDGDLWRELHERVERAGPRYDSRRYGCCQYCGGGPTMLANLSGVVWALCGTCSFVWYIGTGIFEMPAGFAEDEALYQFWFDLLADANEVRVVQDRGGVMLKEKPRRELPPINPWFGALKSNSNPKDVDAAPVFWRETLTEPSRERVGLALIEPDPHRLGVWRRIRARHRTAEDIGEPAMHAVFSEYYIHDGEERKRWATAEAELCAVGPFAEMLRTAEQKLKAGRDVVAMLRSRRDNLNTLIAALEQRGLS